MEKKYTLNINSDNLKKIILKRQEETKILFDEYMEKYYKVKYDKFGNETDANNQYLVSTFFFKSINPMSNVEPIYTGDQLSKVWDLYMKIIEKVNMDITTFPPTLSHFAKFAGVSLEKLKSYKNSLDETMRILIDKIYNETMDANLLLSQNKKLDNKPTEFRLRVENEITEKKAPNVNIDISAKTVDLDKINERLVEIKRLTRNKIEYEGK